MHVPRIEKFQELKINKFAEFVDESLQIPTNWYELRILGIFIFPKRIYESNL